MADHDRAIPWRVEQNRLWHGLAASTITRWVGLDSSVGTDTDVIFLDHESPFQQLRALRLERDGDRPLDFVTYQSEEVFGLSLRAGEGQPQHASKWDRESDVSHLPLGPVESLEVGLDARDGALGDLIEARLSIAGVDLLIVAAEVYPTSTAPKFVWADESLFVFRQPDLVDSVEWADERKYSTVFVTANSEDIFR